MNSELPDELRVDAGELIMAVNGTLADFASLADYVGLLSTPVRSGSVSQESTA